MATNTPNLNLVKPEMSDYADIRVLNGNMDILDKESEKWVKKTSNNTVSNFSLASDDSNITLQVGDKHLWLTSVGDLNPSQILTDYDTFKFASTNTTLNTTSSSVFALGRENLQLAQNVNGTLVAQQGTKDWNELFTMRYNNFNTGTQYAVMSCQQTAGNLLLHHISCYTHTDIQEVFNFTFMLPYANSRYAVVTGLSFQDQVPVLDKLPPTIYNKTNTGFSVRCDYSGLDVFVIGFSD